MKKTKVLFISHEDSNFGAPKSMMELMRTLKKFYNVEPIAVLFSEDAIYEECKKEDIETFVVGHRNFVCGKKNDIKSYLKYPFKYILNNYSDWRAIRKLTNLLENSTVDLIHSNVTINSLGAKLSKKFNIPMITHLREAGTVLDEYLYAKPNYIQFLNNFTTEFISISNFNKNEWVKRGLEQNKVTTIYNGIANGNNTYKSQRKCNGEKIKIVITGALNESKSQDTLIKAIGKLPKKYCEKITLDILGSGDKDYTRYLHDLTKDCKLEGIINLVGYVKNAYSRFSEYDVGVITSKNEAFGRVTAEYMLNGLCVLGANSGATPELISDNYTGLLFEVDDSNNLAEKLQYILENEDLISNIGENARNQALREYTSDINAKNIYKLYMKILKEKV